MKSMILMSCLVCLFTSGVLAQEANIPCLELLIEMASGSEPVSLFSVPDGSGQPLTEAQYSNGAVVDATISLTIMDCAGNGIEFYPSEDIWLASDDGGFAPCLRGAKPDSNTDANGTTHWSQPLMAGGHSNADCYILVSGDDNGEDPIPLHFTSADVNGDGTVNLSDVGWFSSHFFGIYDYGADFYFDGQLDLADVGRLARGLGASCP